jgi:sodium/hydrogen exchanger 8
LAVAAVAAQSVDGSASAGRLPLQSALPNLFTGSAATAAAADAAAPSRHLLHKAAPSGGREFSRGRRAHGESEGESEEEVKPTWAYVMGILGTAATFILGYIIEDRHITWIPEAAIGLMVGFMIAAFATEGWIGPLAFPWAHHMRFDFEFFMTFLLPPIIFEAGFNMKVRPFFANLGPTMFFAFVGTFASTFVVGGIVWLGGQLGLCYPLGPLAALVFGSLISATDPVTVLAVFQALGVKVDLFSMVFGESVLNDAVAIVLSRTLLSFNAPGAQVDAASILAAVVSFVVIFGGSTVIGVLAGACSSLLYKYAGLRMHADTLFLEGALSFIFPWAGYYIAEALELSGIVAIMMAGIVMALFMRHSLSDPAYRLISYLYKVVAQIAETYVFVYLGMAFVAFPIFEHIDWMLISISLFACFVGRTHIFLGSWLANLGRSEGDNPKPISAIYMFVMWFSGLRGGVAFALASVSYAANDFPQRCGGFSSPEAAEALGLYCRLDDSTAILQTTIMIAAFTIFVFGGAITDVAKVSGILTDTSKEGLKAQKKEDYFSKKSDLWTQIDSHLTPWLASAKSHERVHDREHVYKVLVTDMGAESVLNDDRGPDWYFSQENEWALAAVLNNITKVQGQFRGRLLRKKTSKIKLERNGSSKAELSA